jgi:hypothetical protein
MEQHCGSAWLWSPRQLSKSMASLGLIRRCIHDRIVLTSASFLFWFAAFRILTVLLLLALALTFVVAHQRRAEKASDDASSATLKHTNTAKAKRVVRV